MAETAAKTKKTVSSTHAPYTELVKNAINEIKDRKGASRQAIVAIISRNDTLGGSAKMINTNIKNALIKGVSNGTLIQTSGTGAAGRFKVSNAAKPNAPAKVAAPRTPKAAEPAKISKVATATPKKTSGKTAKQVKTTATKTAATSSASTKTATTSAATKSATSAKATETPKSAQKPKKAATKVKPAPKKANK